MILLEECKQLVGKLSPIDPNHCLTPKVYRMPLYRPVLSVEGTRDDVGRIMSVWLSGNIRAISPPRQFNLRLQAISPRNLVFREWDSNQRELITQHLEISCINLTLPRLFVAAPQNLIHAQDPRLRQFDLHIVNEGCRPLGLLKPLNGLAFNAPQKNVKARIPRHADHTDTKAPGELMDSANPLTMNILVLVQRLCHRCIHQFSNNHRSSRLNHRQHAGGGLQLIIDVGDQRGEARA